MLALFPQSIHQEVSNHIVEFDDNYSIDEIIAIIVRLIKVENKFVSEFPII
jgi:hypothetical protein